MRVLEDQRRRRRPDGFGYGTGSDVDDDRGVSHHAASYDQP